MWKKIENKIPVSGLLIKDLPVLDSLEIKEPFLSYKYSIIMTHVCDLESYLKCIPTNGEELQNRQIITQIIFCPAFDEDQFMAGIHLKSQYGFKFLPLQSKEVDKYRKNTHNIRYHYLWSNLDFIPSFFIDFKQYFTLPAKLITDIVGMAKEDLYMLEHLHYTCLADRFAHYLQRVALPSSQDLFKSGSSEEET